MDKVTVKAVVYEYNRTIAASLPPIWSKDLTATQFNIEEVIADAARKMRRLTVKNNTNDNKTSRGGVSDSAQL